MDNLEKNTYVKEQLTAALLRLLKTKELRDISVSEVAAAAGVHRVSFYRSFARKEDILCAHIQKLLQNELGRPGRWDGAPLHQFILALFTHLETHLDFYGLLNERKLSYLLKDAILSLCHFDPQGEAVAVYASAFAAYSIYGWIEVWFRRGMWESAEEMAALFQHANETERGPDQK